MSLTIAIVRSCPCTEHWLYADSRLSIVVKTMRTIVCSSHDGLPLKLKKENRQPDSLKLSIKWCQFRPLLAVVGQYLLAHLQGLEVQKLTYSLKLQNHLKFLYYVYATTVFIEVL